MRMDNGRNGRTHDRSNFGRKGIISTTSAIIVNMGEMDDHALHARSTFQRHRGFLHRAVVGSYSAVLTKRQRLW